MENVIGDSTTQLVMETARLATTLVLTAITQALLPVSLAKARHSSTVEHVSASSDTTKTAEATVNSAIKLVIGAQVIARTLAQSVWQA